MSRTDEQPTGEIRGRTEIGDDREQGWLDGPEFTCAGTELSSAIGQ
jgi:hypothetical protein